MINIAICDDEAYMLDLLTKKVTAFFDKENIDINIYRFLDGNALIENRKRLDIVFLDIQMDKPNGFETAKVLRNAGFNGFIIFITVLQDYVFNVFEVSAFDYLVKPVQDEKFIRTMQRLLKVLSSYNSEHLMIQRGSEWSIVSFADIIYCEIINRKVYIHQKDNAVLDYYDKLEKLEKKLDGRFFRCHRSYLINLQYLKSYQKELAYLTNGETVPVSRLRSDEFSSVILRYMKEWRCVK